MSNVSLVEQIKAKAYCEDCVTKVVPLYDVLKILKPVLAHLQPENRPKLGFAPAIGGHGIDGLEQHISRIDEYFEELDKLIKGDAPQKELKK